MKPFKVYGTNIEQEALDQFHDTMAQDYVVKGACMPDAHKGYTLNIGGVVACKGVIVPSYVGYDIGCGMCAIPTGFNVEDIRTNKEAILNQLYRDIPTGFSRRQYPAFEIMDMVNVPCTEFLNKLIVSTEAPTQLGTMGGNNHFIEIGYSTEDEEVWIITHSGSRNLGKMVASHYMALASNTEREKEGHFPLDVNSQDGKDYIIDLSYCLEFALLNRRLIIEQTYQAINHVLFQSRFRDHGLNSLVNRNHNHAELKDGLWIHRKGATHADLGMLGVIPGNMRDGSFIVRGLGNPESLCSSSHGAGRVRGRSAAHREVSLEDFQNQMKDSECRVVIAESTLEEAPDNYKNIFEVMELQKDLVEVVSHIKPLVTIKAKKTGKRF